MPIDTEKRNKRQYQWQKENTERLNLLFVKGTKAKIQQAAQNRGVSISEYVRLSIDRQIAEDEDGQNIPDQILTKTIEWLKEHGHNDSDILDFMKTWKKE